MNNSKNIETVDIKRYKSGFSEIIPDIVIVENLLHIYVNGKHFAALLYTPGDEENLVAGYLFCQGVIIEIGDIKQMEFRDENIVMVVIGKEASLKYGEIMAATAGCGGGSIRVNLLQKENIAAVESSYTVAHERISENMKSFNGESTLFKETGGVHSCALYFEEKRLIMKEDIGRHNAFDKVIGKALQSGINFEDKLMYTTGRVSSDIMIKAIRGGIPVVVSHSAPTNSAIKLAVAANIALIGFVRGDRMNVYSGLERLK